MTDSIIRCPVCSSNQLVLKYQATYEYSYIIDSDAPGLCNDKELLSYLYDCREQKEAKQFITCESCKAEYPCYFGEWNRSVTASAIQAALDAAMQRTAD